MVKKFNHGARRVFAVALSVLMLLSAWVFVAPDTLPKAHAATAYEYRVRVNSSNNTGGWNSDHLFTLYGKSNNGKGSESSIATKDMKIDFKGEKTVMEGSSAKFPSKVTYKYSFGGGITHREMSATCYIDVKKNGSWINVGSAGFNSNEWGTNSGTKTCSTSSGWPSYTLTAIGGGSDITVPKVSSGTGSTVSCTAFTYPDTLEDDYGVTWYESLTYSTSSGTGISYSNKQFTLNCDANRANHYQLTVTQKLGGTEKSSKTINVTTWDYEVTFKDADNSTVLRTETVDYGQSATAPDTANNVLDHGAGVAAKNADANYHYAFAGWEGDGYTHITSGAQAKNVHAKAYTSSAHNEDPNYTITTTHHKKLCTVCRYQMSSQTHQPKSTYETSSTQHWKLCSVCGSELTSFPKTNHEPKTKKVNGVDVPFYDSDEDGDWIECKTCGRKTTPKAGHTWDFSNIAWDWDGYACEEATLTCTKCGRTKTVDVNVTCVNTPAKCEVDGSNVYTASFTLNGTTYTDTQTEVLEAYGHDYSGAYHALANGEHNRACVKPCNCGTYGLNAEKNAKEACTPEDHYTTDGSQHWIKCEYCTNLTTAKANHTPKATYDTDDDQHWIECSVCAYITTAKANHAWEWVDDVAETCTTDGSKHEFCSTCGLVRSEGTVRPQWGHDWLNPVYTWDDEDFPTKLTATRSCSRGDATETETVNVGYTDDVATCTETGMRHFTSANFHNAAFSAKTKDVELPINPNNHDFTKRTKNADTLKKAATCEGDAIYYMSCSRCNAISDSVTFVDEGSALGHVFNGDVVNAGTGLHYYKCERYDDCEACGIGTEKNTTEACSGGEATCTDRPVCDLCHTIYGNIDPDNHAFTQQSATNTYLKTAATCEDDAVYYYKCLRCTASTLDYNGETWTKDGTARGHKYTGDYNALDGNCHNRACRNGCGTFGLEKDGVMTKDAFEACTPSVGYGKDENQHWVKCKNCSNLTTPRTNHNVPAEYYTDANNHWKACADCGYKTVPEAAHQWGWVIDSEPSCVADGVKHEECSVCHMIRKANTVIPQTGHNWGEVTYTWNADNTEVTATRVCQYVAAHVETETVRATKSVTKETCMADGLITYTSKAFQNPDFNVQIKKETIPSNPASHGLHLKSVALKKATCTVDGERAHYYCDLCEKKFSDNLGTVEATASELLIPAREHSWDAGVVTTAPTCVAEGVKTFTCQNTSATSEYAACHETRTESIAINPANHNGHLSAVALVKATCSADGERAHWFCDACNTKFTDESGTVATTDEALKIPMRAHVWNEGVIEPAPTCCATGVKTFTCTCAETDEYAACTETYTETLAKDPNNHSGGTELRNVDEATCFENDTGYSGDLYCLGCGELLELGHVIPVQSHTYTAETVKEEAFVSAANCASPAIYFKSCKFCGVVSDTETFAYGEKDPTNHAAELGFTAYKAATCLADGNEAYYNCAACGLNFSDAQGLVPMENVVIAQLPHSYTGNAVDLGDGTHKVQCVNGCEGYCEPVAHTWDDGVTVPAKCKTDGHTDFTCTAIGCGAQRHDVLPELGHDWQKAEYKWAPDYSYCIGTKTCANDIKGDGVEDHTITERVDNIKISIPEQPTCQKAGRYVYTATFTNSNFTEQYTSEVIPMGTHVLTKIDAVAPTCTEDGNRAYWICTACGHYFSDADGVNEITLASTFVSRVGHDFSGDVKNNKNGTHSYACIYDCGTYGNKTAHAFNRMVESDLYLETASDCVTPATYFYSCECGEKGTSTFEGTPIGHNLVDHEGKEPTCTEAGYTAHKACTRCDYTEAKSEILPLGHGKFLFDHEKSGRVYDGTFEWSTYSCSRGCGECYTLFTVYAKDTKGNPVVGSEVTIKDQNGAVLATGITGNDGSYTSDVHFSDGEYKIDLAYTSGSDVLTADGTVRVMGSRGSGGVGALSLNSATEPTNPGGNTNPTNPSGGDNTPTNPSGGGDNSDGGSSGGCRYCGGTHDGPFGWLIQLIHNILAAFSGK